MSGMLQVPFGDTFVTRPEPMGPPQAYKTFGMSMPARTHRRRATCEEVMCLPYLNGWRTILPLGSEHVDVVRSLRGRYSFTEGLDDGLVTFTFPPGQACFKASEHTIQLDRPAHFYVAHGDFRGYVQSPRVHQRSQDWVDEFANHTDKIKTAVERG